MPDLWSDREAAEMDSQQYFEEMRWDDEQLRLWEEAQAREVELQATIETLIEQGLELPF